MCTGFINVHKNTIKMYILKHNVKLDYTRYKISIKTSEKQKILKIK